MSKHSVLTPYPIPPALASQKVPNIGDGFILRAIERFFGQAAPDRIFSPRIAPSTIDEGVFRESDLILLAGANQLNDNYTVWPGLNSETIRSHKYRILPVGIGLHGEAHAAKSMSVATSDILRAIHEFVDYSSWRCPLTVAYLEAALPALKGRFLMTGCPVMFDEPLLTERRFHTGADHIAVTITERGEGWFDRERSILQAIHRKYPNAKRTLVLHQDFALLADPDKRRYQDKLRQDIRNDAAALGFLLYVPTNADDAIGFYRSVDMHFGSRVHAHLLMLSQNRKSFVTAFDDRTKGLALAFGFPIFKPEQLDDVITMDFEIIRRRALVAYEAMDLFVRSVKKRTSGLITQASGAINEPLRADVKLP